MATSEGSFRSSSRVLARYPHPPTMNSCPSWPCKAAPLLLQAHQLDLDRLLRWAVRCQVSTAQHSTTQHGPARAAHLFLQALLL